MTHLAFLFSSYQRALSGFPIFSRRHCDSDSVGNQGYLVRQHSKCILRTPAQAGASSARARAGANCQPGLTPSISRHPSCSNSQLHFCVGYPFAVVRDGCCRYNYSVGRRTSIGLLGCTQALSACLMLTY